MDFKNKTLGQIRLWAWAATVLPISGLAGLFFFWRLASSHWLDWLFVSGETIMFTVAVIWWWWAMWTMKRLVSQWDNTRDKVQEVSQDVKEIRSIVLETLQKDK